MPLVRMLGGVIAAMTLLGAPAALAVTLSSWDADGTGSFASGLAGADLTRGPGLTVGNGAEVNEPSGIASGVANGIFSSSGFNNNTNAAGALANGDLITWSLVSAFPLDLNTISFGLDRDVGSNPAGNFSDAEAAGPPQVLLQVSVDDGPFETVVAGQAPAQPRDFDLNLSPVPVGSSFDFRLLAFGFSVPGGALADAAAERSDLDLVASAEFASLGINDAVISIDGAVVPLPATLPLMLGGLGLGALVLRRRG
ncbi:MAG: hypothetical protein ACFBRM_09895 [Pikeienuella sp.]